MIKNIESKDDNKCQNCKYFRFVYSVGCGMCFNSNIKHEKVGERFSCAFWEEKEDEQA